MTVPVHGLPPLVREGLEVAVVPPELRGSRWRRVVSCRSDDRSGSLVALEGVGDLAGSERLVGRYLLARESDLPEGLALHDPERLLGRLVRVEGDDQLATIVEVLTGPANDVWVLRGELGELLLPVIDEVVSDVPDDGPIPVRVPAGLRWEGGADAH